MKILLSSFIIVFIFFSLSFLSFSRKDKVVNVTAILGEQEVTNSTLIKKPLSTVQKIVYAAIRNSFCSFCAEIWGGQNINGWIISKKGRNILCNQFKVVLFFYRSLWIIIHIKLHFWEDSDLAVLPGRRVMNNSACWQLTLPSILDFCNCSVVPDWSYLMVLKHL